MMPDRVLVTGTSVAEKFLKPLTTLGLSIDSAPELLNETELGARLHGATAYLLGGDEFVSPAALARAGKLKVIAFLGVGYESFVDAVEATRLGIPVTNTPGTLTQSVAEFTIGQVLNATRRLTFHCEAARHAAAGSEVPAEQKCHDLAALRVGILGLGAIGTRIAEILATGFGCKVAYFSRTRKPFEEQRLGLSYFELPALMERSDLLIVMTAGNESTRGLVNATNIDRLPKGAILVNTARPDIVEPNALLSALRSDRVSTAVFDGAYDDTFADAGSLLAFPQDRLLFTRHIGSLTHEARDGMARKAVQSIVNVVSKGTDEYIVNGVRAARRGAD
jgi:lactate dehydrogenase-like 2-hydroxyacid dehydrogenase